MNSHGIRICRLAWDYPEDKPSYGLQPVYYYLSKQQAKLGYDVQVITKDCNGQGKTEIRDGVTIHRVGNPFSLNALLRLRSLTNGHKCSIIHTHATCGIFLPALRGTLRAQMVSHVHGTTRSHFMPVRLKFGKIVQNYSRARTLYGYGRERFLWSSADRVLTVSNAIKRDLVSNYGMASDKVRVVYNGVDTNVFKPIMDPLTPNELQPFEGKKVVLFVGHFGLRKGLLFLIRAMKKVTAEVRDARLVCVGGTPSWLGGDEYWTYLRNELESQELREKVLLLDSVPNQLLPTYLSLSNVLVLPSYYEAFGKVVIEAMACARPVIATRRGGVEEVVEDGKTGFLVNYGSVQEMANALVTLLQDEPSARMMGSEGLKTVEAKFTWRKVAQRVSEAYAELLEDAPSMQSAYR